MCPFCSSSNTEKLTDFGTTLAFQQHYCRSCRTVFEAIKWGREPDESSRLFRGGDVADD